MLRFQNGHKCNICVIIRSIPKMTRWFGDCLLSQGTRLCYRAFQCTCLYRVSHVLSINKHADLHPALRPFARQRKYWWGNSNKKQTFWKPRFVIIPTLSSLVTLQFVVMTTYSAKSWHHDNSRLNCFSFSVCVVKILRQRSGHFAFVWSWITEDQ